MSIRFPRLAAAALLFAGAITVGAAAPAFAENSPTSIPIAVDDSYSMMGGTTMTVDYASGLLINDLHAAAWTIISVEAVANETPGELVLESVYKNGAFTYTPAPGFSGIRTFEYQVRDGDLGVVSDNWALVTITVLDPTLPCAVGSPGCPGPVDLPPCDPNVPIEAPAPGDPATCIPGDPIPGDGTDLPCAVGTPGCPPPTDLPPCDPNVPIEAPAPGDPATCIPGDPIPGDGTDLPCAVGTPGCPPPTDLPCSTDVQPVENAEPCIPDTGTTIPDPADPADPIDPVVPVVPIDPVVPVVPEPEVPVTTSTPQLETLAYTGSTVDYRLVGLAAALVIGGVLLLVPRRRAA